ncbi:MAG: hypothetical protein Alpg2KO_23680 [Alphaproteobacteria bacterium]
MSFTPPDPLPEEIMRKLVATAALMRDQAALCLAVVEGRLPLDRAHPAFWRLADQQLMTENDLAESLSLDVESSAADVADFMRWKQHTLARLMPGWSGDMAEALANCVIAFTNYSPIAHPDSTDDGILDDQGLITALRDEVSRLEGWLSANA